MLLLFFSPMYRIISRNVKIAAIQLAEHQHLPLDDILVCCSISWCTFFCIQKIWQTTGDVIPHAPTRSGQPQGLHRDDIHYLLQLIRQNPDYFLDELLHLLKTNHFISVNYSTIHDKLVCAGVSCKRLQCIALESNETQHANFISHMAQFSPEELASSMKSPRINALLGDATEGPNEGLELVNCSHLFVDNACPPLDSCLLMALWQWHRSRV
jgi:hypothetical protein